MGGQLWEKIPSPPNTHGQFCRKAIFWYNWLLKFYITRFFLNFLIKFLCMHMLTGMMRGPIGWERIPSLPNAHGTLYSNARLSNIELLKLHIHTCIFNFLIPFHPIQKTSGSICCVKKKKKISPLFNYCPSLNKCHTDFFLSFNQMGHGCLMYTIVGVLIIFNARSNGQKRIMSPTNTHGRFCKIGIFWNT
jgi:hypothetical protein